MSFDARARRFARQAMQAIAPTLPDLVTPQTRANWTDDDMVSAYATIHDLLFQMNDSLAELLRTLKRKDTKQLPITIGGTTNSGAPYILRTEGYRHSRVFAAGAATINLSDPPGMTLTLAAGWNLLDLRDGCELVNNAAGSVSVLLELTDELVVR